MSHALSAPPKKLADIDQRIAALQRVRDGLTSLVAACPGHGRASDCPILKALGGEDLFSRSAHNCSRSSAPARDVTSSASSGVVYTCPMHPQIRRNAPGNCPICGMTLEPWNPSSASAVSPELQAMKRRLWIGTALTAPLLLWEMAAHLPRLELHRFLSPMMATWLEFALASPVVLWAGWPFFTRAWASVRHRSLNMFTLIALGVGAAYLHSLVATFAPGTFSAVPPRSFRNCSRCNDEAAAVITVLVLLGQVLELRAREQTGGAIRALLNLAPKTAHRITDDGRDEEVPLDQVHLGDPLRIRPAGASRSTA